MSSHLSLRLIQSFGQSCTLMLRFLCILFPCTEKCACILGSATTRKRWSDTDNGSHVLFFVSITMPLIELMIAAELSGGRNRRHKPCPLYDSVGQKVQYRHRDVGTTFVTLKQWYRWTDGALFCVGTAKDSRLILSKCWSESNVAENEHWGAPLAERLDSAKRQVGRHGRGNAGTEDAMSCPEPHRTRKG
eukprot:986083-Rhodomonas_salina.3